MKAKNLLKIEQFKKQKITDSSDVFLPSEQIAEKLQISQRTLRRWAAQGEIERDSLSRYGLISCLCHAIALYDKSGRNFKLQRQIDYNQKQTQKTKTEVKSLRFKKQQLEENLIAVSEAGPTWQEYCEELKTIIGEELPSKIVSRIIARIESRSSDYKEPLKQQIQRETDRALEEELSADGNALAVE